MNEQSMKDARAKKTRKAVGSSALCRAAKANPDNVQPSIRDVFVTKRKDTHSHSVGPDLRDSKRIRGNTSLEKTLSKKNQQKITAFAKKIPSGDVVSEEPTQTAQVDQETLSTSGPSGQSEADTPGPRRSGRTSIPRSDIQLQLESSDEEMLDDDDDIQSTSADNTFRLGDPSLPVGEDDAGAQNLQQPDDGEEPEALFRLAKTTPFKTPDWVIEDIVPVKNKLYLLQNRLNGNLAFRISQLITTAVYDHIDQGTAVQSREVFAILFHELDHIETTVPQRKHYHRFCGQWCDFVKWTNDGNSPESYAKPDYNIPGEPKKAWTRGIFAGINTLYPLAFRQLVGKFRNFASQDLMARCSMSATTNMNESLHSRYHTIVSKHKMHRLPRIKFAAEQVMLTANFGQQKSNLGNVFGTKSAVAEHDLEILQYESHRVSERSHELSGPCKDGTRLKRSDNPDTKDRRKPGPKREPKPKRTSTFTDAAAPAAADAAAPAATPTATPTASRRSTRSTHSKGSYFEGGGD